MAFMGGVLRVTVSHMLWTLPDEVLLQVFEPYGGNEVYVLKRTSCMMSYIFFLSDHDASKAQRALHGRCIYDNCCWMDVQMVLWPSTCSSGVEATKTAPAAATPSIQPSCTSSPSATSAPTTTTVTTAAVPPTPAAPSGRVPTPAPTSTPSLTSTPAAPLATATTPSPTRTFLRFPTPPFLAATKKTIKASRLRHARTAVSVVAGATQAAGSACVTGWVSAVRAPQPVLPRQDPRRKGRSDGCRLSLRRLRRPSRHARGVPTGRLRQARPKRARLRRPRRGARVPRPRVRTRLRGHCRGDGPLRPRRDGRRALGHHRRPPPLRLPRRVRRRAPRPLRRIFHRGRLRLRVQGLGRKHQPRRRALRHGHHRSRRRRHHLPRLRPQHHHHAFRGGLPQGTPGRHPRHRRWELCVRGAGVQSCAGFSRGRRDARGCSSPTPASSTTARSSSTATPTAARTPPTPMPLQYKSWTLVASAWSKPAAVSREVLEMFDGMSCRYITTLQPSQLIEVLLLGCATNFHEGRKQFEEMVEPLDHVVWSVPTSEMSRPLIYSMTQYMMRFLCWELGNGVVGSWFQQAQLTVGFLLEASPWLVLKLSLAVSKLTHIQSWSSWLLTCPRSICISSIFSLVGGPASFFSQLATCWSWKQIIFSCNYSVMIVASLMVVHLHWPKEDQLRPTPWPSFSKEHLRRLLSVARVPFPIEVSLQQSNLDSVHWHTGSSLLYILELKPWPSPAAFRSINTSWSMLSFGAFWCVQLLGNNVNLQAHGKANLMVNTNTCWMVVEKFYGLLFSRFQVFIFLDEMESSSLILPVQNVQHFCLHAIKVAFRGPAGANFIQLLLKAGAILNISDDLGSFRIELAALRECKQGERLLPLTLSISNVRNWSVARVIFHAKSENTKPLDQMHFDRAIIKSQTDLAFSEYVIALKCCTLDWAPACYRQAAPHMLLEYKQACDVLLDVQKLDPGNDEIEELLHVCRYTHKVQKLPTKQRESILCMQDLEAPWDLGGFKSGLRASRISSGGECHVLGLAGLQQSECMGWQRGSWPKSIERGQPDYKGEEGKTSEAIEQKSEPELVFYLPSAPPQNSVLALYL